MGQPAFHQGARPGGLRPERVPTRLEGGGHAADDHHHGANEAPREEGQAGHAVKWRTGRQEDEGHGGNPQDGRDRRADPEPPAPPRGREARGELSGYEEERHRAREDDDAITQGVGGERPLGQANRRPDYGIRGYEELPGHPHAHRTAERHDHGAPRSQLVGRGRVSNSPRTSDIRYMSRNLPLRVMAGAPRPPSPVHPSSSVG